MGSVRNFPRRICLASAEEVLSSFEAIAGEGDQKGMRCDELFCERSTSSGGFFRPELLNNEGLREPPDIHYAAPCKIVAKGHGKNRLTAAKPQVGCS